MTEELVTTGMAMLWAQVNPNTVPVGLACYVLGDIERPKGDSEQIICQDPVTPNEFIRKAITTGPGGIPTTSVEGLMARSRDWLEKEVAKNSRINLYWTVVPCAPKTTFNNHTRGLVFQYGRANSSTLGNLMARDGNTPATTAMDFSGEDVQEFGAIGITRQTTAEVNTLRDIAALPFRRPQGECGQALEKCDLMYIACDRTGAVTANVLYSADGGVTWANTSADPFAVSEDISCIESIMIDGNTLRLLVGRGSTDAGNPAEIAYADVAITAAPQTTVWNLVNISNVNADYILGQGGLFALDFYHIWACVDGGQILFSQDGGLTWAVQLTGVVDEFRDMHFVNHNVGICVGGTTGASHVIYVTTDGGAHWAAITMTGPGAAVMATSCMLHDEFRLWVGFEDGSLYFSNNGGDTWAARILPATVGSTARAELWDIERVDDFCFWIATGHTKTAAFWPTIYRTVNGGNDWQYVEAVVDVAAGTHMFQKVLACDGYNEAFAVGEVDAGPLGAIYAIYEM